ncbi:MAG: outer membrane beta-barrel protein [Bacteroidota bacterium]
MKKFFMVAVVALVVATTSQAQEYRPFKVGLGFGYASPAGEGSRGGVLLYLEPAYRVSDQISVGLRLESAIMGRAIGNEDGADIDLSGNGSYTVNGQYYLGNGTFRPLVGLGLGIYSLANISLTTDVSGSSGEISAGSEFGFYPRVGFDLGHFNFSIDYNIIPSSTNQVEFTTGNPEEVEVKNSYLGVRFGFSIGGGRN